jgi:SAM-dependent methyltransferase
MMNQVLQEQKQQSMESLHLAPGMAVLEVGCGLGLDAETLAARVGPAGRVVGIDASHDLIAAARQRTAVLDLSLEFAVGDAHALGFPDSFDAARTDRVLQHLSDPAKAVREMARVVRPGGRLAVLEPDWESVAVGGVDRAIARALVRYKADVAIAHGTVGRDVRGLLVEAGCEEVMARQGAITFGSLEFAERVMSLRASLDGAVRQGWVDAARAETWWDALKDLDQAGKFFAAMSGIVASATVA